MLNEDGIVKTNMDFLVTETVLDPKIPIDQVVDILTSRKTTGQLCFALSQGSVQKVSLVEKTRAGDKQRPRLRKVLDV